jgi:hypothetical protein
MSRAYNMNGEEEESMYVFGEKARKNGTNTYVAG